MKYLYTTPIDMPRGTHYGNNYWLFQSRKVGRRVSAYSNLEYENLICLEMDPNVEFYCEQPCEQTVFIDGGRKNTVFDVYVVYKDGREELHEVKYSEELESNTPQSERDRKQIEIQKNWCLQNNIEYNLRTDKDIERGPHTIRNLCFLCAKARRYTGSANINENSMIQFIKEHPSITIGQLHASGRITTQSGLDYLSNLFYKGLITFKNLDNEVISNTTEVILYGK